VTIKVTTPFVFLVGQGGVEPPTLGFSVDNLKQVILHHFQALKYHALTKAIFGFVGLGWFIFGSEGYPLVTAISLAPLKKMTNRIISTHCKRFSREYHH
jgi:hypothetical protein